VARYLFKLMAYKDEYEVARLHTDKAFTDKIAGMFEGDYKIVHHMAPPLMAKKQRQGRAGQAAVRPLDAPGVQAAGPAQGPARRRARHLRQDRGAPHGARADREYRACIEELLKA
jgi:indolepyruvate ferredoxin oxidoreductase